jgi:hypothetical protein
MRREEYRGSTDTESRDYDREEYNRGFENRGGNYGRDYEMRGRNDRDYERNFSGRERGYGRDFDEDRGFGYGRYPGNMGYSNFGGYGGEGVFGQNWGGRNYSQSGYGGGNYSPGQYGYGSSGQYGSHYGQPGSQFQPGQRFYGQRNDQEIEHEVYDRLDNEWQIPDNADIHAQVREGVVTLTGQVRNRNAKMAAWNCVWQIPGVEDVQNNIQIQSRRRQNQSQGTFSGNEQGQSTQPGAQGSSIHGTHAQQRAQSSGTEAGKK